jgi:putative ABC transport system ATP-binding protein
LILKTSALAHTFRSGQRILFPDLEVHAGEKVTMVGASGSGKSTLLNLITGVLPLQTGSIQLKEFKYEQLSGRDLDAVRADHIGVIFQSLNLVPYLTALDNAQLGLQFSRRRRSQVSDTRTVISELAIQLGLSADLLGQKPSELSIGQQQRVAAIRALIGKPELIIADEPTSALDPHATQLFMDQLSSSIDPETQAVIVVSHNPSIIPLFDRVISIGDEQ